jgi:phosphoglycolate phosphatase
LKLSIAAGGLFQPLAVVFDLDGTLIDSREDIAAACNHALAVLGRPPLPIGTIASFVGDGARLLLARALGLPSGAPEVDRALDAFRPYYEANPATHTRLMPGAREALDALGDRPLAICTNKPRGPTLAVLDAFGITSRFVAIRAGGDGPLKPDPSAVTDVVRSMRSDPRRTWMVGDGEQDVRAGRGAGCVTIAIRGGFGSEDALDAAQPDMVLGTLHDLVSLVKVRSPER